MNSVFVTATNRDTGKTAFTVGLLELLQDEFEEMGYMKPLGQRYVMIDGERIEEDVELLASVYDFDDSLRDMSPIVIHSGFTRANLGFTNTDGLMARVMESYDRMKRPGRAMVLEGAGKSSVGDNFGLSNVRVAELVEAGVILITEGGIGHTIDQCMLHKAYLEQFDIDVLGVVINKVYKSKLEEIAEVTGGGLRDRGFDILGVIPYEPMLSSPTLRSVVEEMEIEFLTTKHDDCLDRLISNVLVGAMKPHQALGYLQGGELLITGGDREDILISVLCWSAMSEPDPEVEPVTGIMVTGGIEPPEALIEVAEELGIQMFLTSEDTYQAAASVKDLRVKIKPEDHEKISSLSKLVDDHVDVARIMEYIG